MGGLQGQAKATSRLWTFLNSSFCIFLLSSVVLSGLSYAYAQYSAGKGKAETVQRLDVEIAFRVVRAHDLLNEVLTYTEVNTGRFCIIGGTSVGPGGMVLNDPYHTFDEFKDRGLIALVWELNGLLSPIERRAIAPALESAKRMAALVRNQEAAFLMTKGLDEVTSGDSLWTMRAPAARELRAELAGFEIPRWTRLSHPEDAR